MRRLTARDSDDWVWMPGKKMTKRDLIEAMNRLCDIEDIFGDNYDLNLLQELMGSKRDGRVVVLPKVPEKDVKLFAENLKDVFDDWANYDPSVGIFGMSDEEAALAGALMRGLESVKEV